MPFIDLFSALCGNGMLESMLEPHLRYAGASTMEVGVSFLLFGCCYMLGNIFFGGVIKCTFKCSQSHELIFLTLNVSLSCQTNINSLALAEGESEILR